MKLLEEIEYLASQVQALVEAEGLAIQAQPHMLPEIRKLYYSTSKRLRALAKKLLSHKPSLRGSGPRVPLEIMERLFLVLRDQAEIALARASKLHRQEARQAMKEADQLAKLARTAATTLKMVADVRGVWSNEYSKQHGLGPWL